MRAPWAALAVGAATLVAGASLLSSGAGGVQACSTSDGGPGGACVHSALVLTGGIIVLLAGAVLAALVFARRARRNRLERGGEYRAVPRSWVGGPHRVGPSGAVSGGSHVGAKRSGGG